MPRTPFLVSAAQFFLGVDSGRAIVGPVNRRHCGRRLCECCTVRAFSVQDFFLGHLAVPSWALPHSPQLPCLRGLSSSSSAGRPGFWDIQWIGPCHVPPCSRLGCSLSLLSSSSVATWISCMSCRPCPDPMTFLDLHFLVPPCMCNCALSFGCITPMPWGSCRQPGLQGSSVSPAEAPTFRSVSSWDQAQFHVSAPQTCIGGSGTRASHDSLEHSMLALLAFVGLFPPFSASSCFCCS